MLPSAFLRTVFAAAMVSRTLALAWLSFAVFSLREGVRLGILVFVEFQASQFFLQISADSCLLIHGLPLSNLSGIHLAVEVLLQVKWAVGMLWRVCPGSAKFCLIRNSNVLGQTKKTRAFPYSWQTLPKLSYLAVAMACHKCTYA